MAPYYHLQQDQHPRLLADSLYCSEQQQHWEEEQEQEYCCGGTGTATNAPPMLLEQDMSWEEEELKWLLSKEEANPVCAAELELARREAVEWVMKVNAHYSFSALTAVVAVNYLDRFLSTLCFHNGKPWMSHLAAVACISLAAKVHETRVPLLLDFQVEDSRYVFEAKTIQRMEILVLSTLGWKMNPPTPLSFIDYVTRRLGLEDYLCWEFLRRCQGLLLSLLADSRFMSYLPSVLATATMMHVVSSVEPGLGGQLLDILGINKDKVDECCKLMLQVRSSGYDHQQCNKRKLVGSVPGSPNGVMDVSFSGDSSNESWSVSSSPEPFSKKPRTQQHLLLNPSNSNFISIPR